jgi:SpoIID/LytB domain protein
MIRRGAGIYLLPGRYAAAEKDVSVPKSVRVSTGKQAAALALLAITLVMVAIAACETAEGFKRDVSQASAGASEAAPSVGAPAPKYYAPAKFDSEPDIRVRIAKGVTKKEIGGPERLLVRPVQTSSSAKSQMMKGPVTITTSAAGIVVVDGAGTRATWPVGTDLEVMLSEGSVQGNDTPPPPLRMDKQRIPGFLTIRQGKDATTRFDVIATMPIETYLPGVVTNELLKDWNNLQLNEIQAVCARTYALHERARARAERRPVDVENTTADQVYAAYSSSVAQEAVRATRGMVLVSEGNILRAYFSSCCGGRSGSAADVWPNTDLYVFNRAKPLQGKPRQFYCQPSPLYRWSVTRSDEDFNQRIRAWGLSTQNKVASLSRLRKVELADVNDAGRPNRFRLVDDRGQEFILKAEEFRVACNQTVPDLPPITKETRVNSADVEVEVWANQIQISGRGWGHGVGMCQWCAKGMAEAGMDWHTMAQTFYPGVEIQRAY